MPRRDTRLESEAAEFFVLGQLLLRRIFSYKTYTRLPGYDLVATDPERGRAARIQVKSRWATGASGFLIKNFASDFVVVVRLNRGKEKGERVETDPEFFVFPTSLMKRVKKSKSWGKVYFRDIPKVERYKDAWTQIADFLERAA